MHERGVHENSKIATLTGCEQEPYGLQPKRVFFLLVNEVHNSLRYDVWIHNWMEAFWSDFFERDL